MVVTDIDGTLMNDNNEIPCNTSEYINVLIDNGVKFVVASGRHINNLKSLFGESSANIIFIAQNGAYVECNNSVLFYNTINREIINKILFLATALKLKVMLYTQNSVIITDESSLLQIKLKKYNVEYIINKEPDVDSVCKISLIATDDVDIYRCKNVLEQINGISVYVSNKDMLDITNNNINKGTALNLLQNLYGVTPKETAVFGDSENDIEMFKFSDFSYAMENADNIVKKHAQYIAPSNNNNGVFNTIKLLFSNVMR